MLINILCVLNIFLHLCGMKKAKLIHLSPEAVKVLSILAIEQGTKFKGFVEGKLEEMAGNYKRKK